MFGFGSSKSDSEPRTQGKEKKVEEVVKDFIAKEPGTLYTFDSERNAPRSKLCRESKRTGRECIMVEMYATKLFEAMQANGFYCCLPSDPSQTYMECKPMPKA